MIKRNNPDIVRSITRSRGDLLCRAPIVAGSTNFLDILEHEYAFHNYLRNCHNNCINGRYEYRRPRLMYIEVVRREKSYPELILSD